MALPRSPQDVARPARPRVRRIAAAVLMAGLLTTACDPGALRLAGGNRQGGPAAHATSAAAGSATKPAAAQSTAASTTKPTVAPTTVAAASGQGTTTTAATTSPLTVPPNSTPTPPVVAQPPAPSSSGTPGAGNTGVPSGVRLSPYTGPCEITADNTVIDSKTVSCSLDIRAAGVVISKSKVNGPISLDTDLSGSSRWSLRLEDSEVDGGTSQIAAVGWGNMTVLRANVHGGQTSVQCGEKALSCTVRDSWLHGQYLPANANWHLGGFLSNGGHNIELTGNTIICDARPNAADGGCTGNLNLLPDFAPISQVLVQDNFFQASPGAAYCTYGGDSRTKPFPNADHVVYRDNRFERGSNGKCATYGAVTGFDVTGAGNVWANNTWSDGTAVTPVN